MLEPSSKGRRRNWVGASCRQNLSLGLGLTLCLSCHHGRFSELAREA